MKTATCVQALIATCFFASSIAVAAGDHKGHEHNEKKSSEHAHDAKPVHGGVVAVVKDMNYELVAKSDRLTLYVSDHGKPVDTKNATATMTMLSASGKAEATLTADGDNKLSANGKFPVEPGTKAVAVVKLEGMPAQPVRFVLK